MPMPRLLETLREARDLLIFVVEVAAIVGLFVAAVTAPAEKPLPLIDVSRPWGAP